MQNKHKLKYYLGGKRNKVLTHTTTCMELTNITLSKRSQIKYSIVCLKYPEEANFERQWLSGMGMGMDFDCKCIYANFFG